MVFSSIFLGGVALAIAGLSLPEIDLKIGGASFDVDEGLFITGLTSAVVGALSVVLAYLIYTKHTSKLPV